MDQPNDVLLVEDNMIIALDTEDMLRELGVATVRVAGTVAEALRAIEERHPDFALLDVGLGEQETSFEVADRLGGLNIPYAFATGYGENVAFSVPPYDSAPKISKPYSAESLRRALTQGR